MDKVKEFINQDETLKATASLRLPLGDSHKKEKESVQKSWWGRAKAGKANKFKDYDFTPLNAEISEVLMEIKIDPKFCRPPKIPGNPPYKNEGKYCDFYEQTGHYIEGWMALRLLIEKLIKNGKLVQFLGEKRNQPGNNRPQNRGDYHPQDQ
jgi:hypothetical protein